MTDQEAHDYYADPAHREATGPGRKHPKDQLTEFLSFRVSPSMLARVNAAAEAEDRSAGAWIRQTLKAALEMDAVYARLPRPAWADEQQQGEATE